MRILSKKGIAEVEKTPEPFSVTRKLGKGRFEGQFHKNLKAQPDFQGTLGNGYSIAFEAKCTLKDRINKNVVSEAQQSYLDSHTAMGAYTGVCVMVNKTVGFIPWSIWINMKEFYGWEYMTEEEVSNFAVKTPRQINFLDFIEKNTFYDYRSFGRVARC